MYQLVNVTNSWFTNALKVLRSGGMNYPSKIRQCTMGISADSADAAEATELAVTADAYYWFKLKPYTLKLALPSSWQLRMRL